MENKKLITTAKSMDILVKTLGRIFQIVGIVCGVFAVLVGIFGEKMFKEASLTLELGFVKLYMAEQYQTITPTVKLYTILGLVSVCVLCAVVWYICRCVRRILEPMVQGRPFESQVAANLKKTGWAVLIGGGVMELAGWAECLIRANHYPLAEIISTEAVRMIEYDISVDFGFVLIAGVLFFLSYVFAYGQQLQQQADETL